MILKKINEIFKSFFDVKHSIKAKIFVSFTIATIAITAAISLYWYQVTIKSTTDALRVNMEKSTNSSMVQLENAIGDIKEMHSTLIYETNSLEYIIENKYSPPDAEWFKSYKQIYMNLRTMNINFSRTVSGIGIFKVNGETCINGYLPLDNDIFSMNEIESLKKSQGNDVIFFTGKAAGETQNEVLKYIFVGRSVLDKGEEKAVIITKLNESIFNRIFSEGVYPKGFVLLLDNGGNVVYDSSPGQYLHEKDRYIKNPDFSIDTHNREKYLVFSKKAKYTGMTVISAIPYEYIDDLNKTIRMQLFIMLIIEVLVIAVISMVISDKVTMRLKSLSRNMKKVGNGSMTELSGVNGEDEVGQLSVSFIKMTNQIQKLILDIKQNERQKREMEIKVLRAQISPHFLYNSLNTINYLALLQNSQNIHVLTSSLIDLLQGAVNVDDQLISVEDEVKYVKSYINVQRYRFPQEIQVDYQIEAQVENYKVPKMILQPIVENAIIHGFAEVKKDSMLRIRAYTPDQESLVFNITDNGIGMSAEKIETVLNNNSNNSKIRFSGIGVGNVDSRIKLQFGDDFGISIYSRERVYTTVEIKLPIIEEHADI